MDCSICQENQRLLIAFILIVKSASQTSYKVTSSLLNFHLFIFPFFKMFVEIFRIGEKLNDKKAKCPLCRDEIMLPEGGIDKLPVNPFILKEKDEDDDKPAALNCEICENGTLATFRCLQCDQLFCDTIPAKLLIRR